MADIINKSINALEFGIETINLLTDSGNRPKKSISLIVRNEAAGCSIQYVNYEIREGNVFHTPLANKSYKRGSDFLIQAEENSALKPEIKQWHTIKYCDFNSNSEQLIVFYVRHHTRDGRLAIGLGSTKEEAKENCKNTVTTSFSIPESKNEVDTRPYRITDLKNQQAIEINFNTPDQYLADLNKDEKQSFKDLGLYNLMKDALIKQNKADKKRALKEIVNQEIEKIKNGVDPENDLKRRKLIGDLKTELTKLGIYATR